MVAILAYSRPGQLRRSKKLAGNERVTENLKQAITIFASLAKTIQVLMELQKNQFRVTKGHGRLSLPMNLSLMFEIRLCDASLNLSLNFEGFKRQCYYTQRAKNVSMFDYEVFGCLESIHA